MNLIDAWRAALRPEDTTPDACRGLSRRTESTVLGVAEGVGEASRARSSVGPGSCASGCSG